MRKEHAEHNEELCNDLIGMGKYPDWVITAAFYSAMHYSQHQIFPLKRTQRIFRDINEFQAYFKRAFLIDKSKHQLMIDLVHDEIKGAGASYQWLFDKCMTARYKNYKIDDKYAAEAKNKLETIKGCCDKL